MIKIYLPSILICLCLLAGCNAISNSDLEGSWQAVGLINNDKSVKMDLSQISLVFEKSGTYKYTGTMDYREAGFFQIDDKYLYTIDTVNQGSSEKAVEILKFGKDSLFIKMMEKGNERLLKFVKKK